VPACHLPFSAALPASRAAACRAAAALRDAHARSRRKAWRAQHGVISGGMAWRQHRGVVCAPLRSAHLRALNASIKSIITARISTTCAVLYNVVRVSLSLHSYARMLLARLLLSRQDELCAFKTQHTHRRRTGYHQRSRTRNWRSTLPCAAQQRITSSF